MKTKIENQFLKGTTPFAWEKAVGEACLGDMYILQSFNSGLSVVSSRLEPISWAELFCFSPKCQAR